MCNDHRRLRAGFIFFSFMAVSSRVALASTVLPSGADRQGGDIIESATPIHELPFVDSGTTTGYHDDYDASCPQDGAAPDVCYRYTPR